MNYNIRERSAMLALMALGREVYNKELDDRYHLGLNKSQRERLNADKLVKSSNNGARGFAHELTDKGWAWARAELRASVPARAGSAGGGLYAVLNGLALAIERRGMTPSEFFATAPNDPIPVRPVADQIKAAYRRLAKRPHDWVYLSDLRPHIIGASKEDIDRALKQMFHAREVNLTLEEDQSSLTVAQRAASVRLGVDDMHLVRLE